MPVQNSNQFWIKLIFGGILGMGTYGLLKHERQEKWTLKGAVDSFLDGATIFSSAEPGKRKVAVPLPQPKMPPVKYTPPGFFSKRELYQKLSELLKKLEELEEMTRNFSQEEKALPVYSMDKVWESILVPGSVILIIGKRGSGKSALGYLILEIFSYRTRCYVVNLPEQAHNLLPEYIGVLPSVEDAPCGSCILVDEAALEFPARTCYSEKNRKLLEVISLARQRRQIIVFVSHDTSYIDINILRGLSSLIIKEPSPLQEKFERYEMRGFINKARLAFDKITEDKRNWAYVAFSPSGYEGLVRTPKPSFFSDKLSNCYASFAGKAIEKEPKVLSKNEKKEKAYMLYTKEGLSIRQVAKHLGVSKSTAHNWIKEIEEKKKQSQNILDRIISQLEQIGNS